LQTSAIVSNYFLSNVLEFRKSFAVRGANIEVQVGALTRSWDSDVLNRTIKNIRKQN